MTPRVFDRVILDLCGGSGAWSRPYVDAGYDVRVVTMPADDVRLYEAWPYGRVHGVLAAPPCTYFCRMRMCRGEPSSEQFLEGLSVVDACLRVVAVTNPVWWALENPQGYLKRWLGEPAFKFDPCEYGDPWTKRTWLWGSFVPPNKRRTVATGPLIHRKAGKRGTAVHDSENAVTPPGFALAFMEANP
jgi:hypothetical protein